MTTDIDALLALDDAHIQALTDAYFAAMDRLRGTPEHKAIEDYTLWMHEILVEQLGEIARLMDINEQMRKHIIHAGLMELSDPIERKGRNHD